MQLPVLFYLSLMWILQYQAKGNTDTPWKIHVNRTITGTPGSNITIQCKFEVPSNEKTDDVQIFWKTNGKSDCSKNDKDKEAFAFHFNSSCIHPHFQKRTKLIRGNSKNSCSLMIFNILEKEPEIYLRIIGQTNNYSFTMYKVKIKAPDQNSSSLRHTDAPPDISITTLLPIAKPASNDDGNIKVYLGASVPLLGLLVIAVAGLVAYKLHKRLHTFQREESGYYVNFKQTSSNPPKSESSRKASDTKPPDPKVIDDPVYMNLETSANQMDQPVERVENVYGNVDYTA